MAGEVQSWSPVCEKNPTQQQLYFQLPAPETGKLPFSSNPRAQTTPAFSHCKLH